MNIANATTITFDQDKPGASPAGWRTGVTGRGSPKWSVEADPTAPSPPHVLKQGGSGTFPWCVKDDAALADGYVEVKFKPLSGNEDQAGGVVWRFKDGNNYYVARANALEGNVSLYYTQNGRRITIKYVDAPVPRNTWHTLRVDFSGKNIRVTLNGKPYIVLRTIISRAAGRSECGPRRTASPSSTTSVMRPLPVDGVLLCGRVSDGDASADCRRLLCSIQPSADEVRLPLTP